MAKDTTDFKEKLRAYGKGYVETLKKRWWLLLIEAFVLALTLVLDLVSKHYVCEFLLNPENSGGTYPLAPGFIVLEYSQNTGGGFGILSGSTNALTAITMIVIIALLAYLLVKPHENEWVRMSLILIVGGGIGNNVDRINLHYVRDFIKYDFLKNFAICNVADVFVTVGTVMLIIVLVIMLVQEGRKNKKEFEKERAGKPEELHEDPLDAPINLNPMMESPNTYIFEEPKESIGEEPKAEEKTDESGVVDDTQQSDEIAEVAEEKAGESSVADDSEQQSDEIAEVAEETADESGVVDDTQQSDGIAEEQ